MDRITHEDAVDLCSDSRLVGAVREAIKLGVSNFISLPDLLCREKGDPKSWSNLQIQTAIAVACRNRAVHIEDYTYLVQGYHQTARHQQPWHLAEKGLPVYRGGDAVPGLGVVPRDCYLLYVTPKNELGTPNQYDKRKTRSRLPDPNFDLNGGCQTCDNPVATAQGHRDYDEPSTPENSIRQCEGCNGTTKDTVIWGPGSRPRPIGYSARGLRSVIKKSRISKETRDKMLAILEIV